MSNAWQRYKERNGITPVDLLKSLPMAPEDVQKQRYSICESCPEFISLTQQCKECGCFMKLKSKYESAKCPLEKW